MLRSELQEIEKCVDSIINEQRIGLLIKDKKRWSELTGRLQICCADLKEKWTHEFFSKAKEPVIKRYVQFHQSGIIALADQLSNYPRDSDQDNWGALAEACNHALETLQVYLQRHFYLYFDIDHPASRYHCEKINDEIALLRPALQENQLLVGKPLVDCLLKSIDDLLLDGKVSGITYRQCEQSLNLTKMVQQLLLSGTETTDETLIRVLYQQNLNSLYFLNWYKGAVTLQLDQHSDQRSKGQFVIEQLKTLEGIYVAPEKALFPELPSTNEVLINWLHQQADPSGKSIAASSGGQLPLNLSVPQFALFIRIFYKSGCFPVENVALITRFFTEHFTTKKQPRISRKSFGRAFYNLDQSAAAIVRDYLQKMLNYLNKTYFP